MSFITALGTATPPTRLAQSTIADFMIKAMQLEGDEARKLRALYRATGIDFRHSVIEDYGRHEAFAFYANSDTMEPFPTTRQRLELYRTHSVALSERAIREAVKHLTDFQWGAITHLVVVSCTGMYAPGLDIDLVKALGLRSNVQRLCINFMGCYAAFNGIKLADTFCQADANAKVLVVCTELCSIHFQKKNTEDNLLANALFADGSAAVLVEGKPRAGLNLKPEGFFCDLALQGEREMAWTVGDLGFEMRLTSYVPDIIRHGIRALTNTLLGNLHVSFDDISYFAIHPGGKKILEAIEEALTITKTQNQHAYQVLRNHGNMSSPTVLFVLQALRATLNGVDSDKKILSFAFGPGLTLESMVLSVHNEA
ncbi:MAG: type III polyketide synthase [Cyclobacteriaceae bacterium]|jgi:prepilin-type processing-associated H-X9-DG protein|nr:type III polyketide synthase [Cyclobacteriaceae bacterium]